MSSIEKTNSSNMTELQDLNGNETFNIKDIDQNIKKIINDESLEKTNNDDKINDLHSCQKILENLKKLYEECNGPCERFISFYKNILYDNKEEYLMLIENLEQLLENGFLDEYINNSISEDKIFLSFLIEELFIRNGQENFPFVIRFIIKLCKQPTNGNHYSILHEATRIFYHIYSIDDVMGTHALESLIYVILNKIESNNFLNDTKSCLESNKKMNLSDEETNRSSCNIIKSLLFEVIEQSIDHLELAKVIERSFNQCQEHKSIYGDNFAKDIHLSCASLFDNLVYRNVYLLIATISKIIITKTSKFKSHMRMKDISYIQVSIYLLGKLLSTTGKSFRSSFVFGQQIRRFVCSCITCAITICVIPSTETTCDIISTLFRSIIQLILILWEHHRKYLKFELTLFFENIFLRILKMKRLNKLIYNMQNDILSELTKWFQIPHNIVEMFLNCDMDRQLVHQWKIFEQICNILCNISEGNMEIVTSEDKSKNLQEIALDTVIAILRSIMDASGHSHLISRDERTRHLSIDNGGGWESNDSKENITQNNINMIDNYNTKENKNINININKKLNTSHNNNSHNNISLRLHSEEQKKTQQILKKAMEISKSKGLKKAIDYLLATNFINRSAQDIASFLRIYHDYFDESSIGDYLGEGDDELKVHLRLTYVRAISFKGKSLIQSLRHFLTYGGFRLPGEAQKIERMVESFAQCYYNDAPGLFSSSDTVMILSYSIIMLNTDLHNPQVKKNKMSKEQFIKNNRGIDNGKDIPKNILQDIYDDILNGPIRLNFHNYKNNNNNNRHHSHTNNNNNKNKKTNVTTNELLQDEKFHSNLIKSITQTEELMKGQSHIIKIFYFVGIDASMSPDLIKLLFERIWFHFLALSTTVLTTNQSNLNIILKCLDILRYCISICLFLDMNTERHAFCTQLSKLRFTDFKQDITSNNNNNNIDIYDTYLHKKDKWFKNIEEAILVDDLWRVISEVHITVNELKEKVEIQQKHEIFLSVINSINIRNYEDIFINTKTFIRQGDLTKKCRSKNCLYRFFLFNDQLIYADKGIYGKWNIHMSLRLRITRIVDVPDTLTLKNAFHILNASKSFIVYGSNPDIKTAWLRDIKEAIQAETSETVNATRRFSLENQMIPINELNSNNNQIKNIQETDIINKKLVDFISDDIKDIKENSGTGINNMKE